jgi:hypothetical protein
MNIQRRFSIYIFFTQILILFQRSLRLIIRACWLGLGGVLVAQAGSSWFSWLENPGIQYLAGAGLAVFPLLGIFYNIRKNSNLVWSIDRKYGYKEQLSTAYHILKNKRSDPLGVGLIEDALVLMKKTVKRLLWRGWFFERDLISLILIILMAALVWAPEEEVILLPELASGAKPGHLPPLPQTPTIEDVFPNGIFAHQASLDSHASSPVFSENTPPATPLSNEEIMMLENAFSEMAGRLNSRMSTLDLSQYLEKRDLNSAAEELENLSDQLELISEETRMDLSEAMEAALSSLDSPNLEQFQESLEKASSSLAEQSSQKQLAAKWDLDNVASEMRSLADALSMHDEKNASSDLNPDAMDLSGGAGIGETSSQVNSPNRFERLPGLDKIEIIELPEPSSSGVLLPGSSSQEPTDVVQGNYARLYGSQSGMGAVPIIPYYYPWYLRNVIETYFHYFP